MGVLPYAPTMNNSNLTIICPIGAGLAEGFSCLEDFALIDDFFVTMGASGTIARMANKLLQ